MTNMNRWGLSQSLASVRGAGAAFALVGAFSVVAACGDGDRLPKGLDVAEATPASSSADDWLRSQQMLRVKQTVNGTVTETSMTVQQAMVDIQRSCDPYFTPGSCYALWLDEIKRNMCMTRTLLALSTTQSEPITIVWALTSSSPVQKRTYDRVTEANAAEFASYAADYARLTFGNAINNLRNPNSACRVSGIWTNDFALGSDARQFASEAVTAYFLGRSAYDRAFEATMNVADSARSGTASATEAGERSYLLSKFSRAAAAHMMVGGDDGLLGSSTAGFCSTPLSPNAQEALKLLRDAAPNPAILSPNTSISDLLQGTDTNAPGSSVRKRLAAFHKIGVFGFNPTSGLVDATPSQSVEEYYGLTQGDFEQARQYLKQEVEIFGRTKYQLDPTIVGLKRYAGTAGVSVSPPPAGSWSARARHAVGVISPWYDRNIGTWYMAPNGATPATLTNYRPSPLETFIGQAYAEIQTLIRTTTDRFSSTSATAVAAGALAEDQKPVLGVLGDILTAKEYLGAVELSIPMSKISIRATTHGIPQNLKSRVMVGEDGLRCAVEGHIEGVSCNDNGDAFANYGATDGSCPAGSKGFQCLTIAIPNTLVNTGNTYFGTTFYVDGTRTLPLASSLTDIINTKTRLYWVRLKDPALPQSPGNYELLAGTTVQAGLSSGSPWNLALPVVPTVDARVASALAPNPKNCVENKVSCVGVEMDARLPLEDELTDDGNGFENSWRHYLTLARQAADESALLGREFREAKLSQLQGEALAEQRREERRQSAANALQEVQNLCGTALDTDKLLDYLSSGGSGAVGDRKDFKSLLGTGSCPETGGRCVADFLAVVPGGPNVNTSALDAAELKRFKDCIDDSPAAIDRFVTLGDKPFCVYTSGSSVCPGTSPCFKSEPCADVINREKYVAKPLGYFTTPVGKTLELPDSCRLLRIARGTHDPTILEDLVARDTFNPDRLKDKVGQLGFKAQYGGFFAITEDGSPRYNSGHGVIGRGAGWPWAGKAPGCTTTDGGTGLFCEELPSGATAEQIGALNSRAFRATYAAAGLLGEGLDVVYPSGHDSGNQTPCDGKKYEAEYHKASASNTNISPNQTLWTCAGRVPSYLNQFVNQHQSFHPRGGTSPTAWITPTGSLLTGSLNLWGAGAPRCFAQEQCGIRHNCETVYNCGWDKMASTIPGPNYAEGGEAMSQAWAGLAAGTMYAAKRGIIYDVLAGTQTDMSPVLLEGGSPNNYMSNGTYFEPKVPMIRDASMRYIWNGYYKLPFDLNTILDGQELLCELDRRRAAGDVPTLLDLTSVDQAVEAVEKFADALNQQGLRMMFANVPTIATNAMAEAGPTGAFPGLSADMGEAVADLRQGLVSTRHAVPAMSDALRSLALELRMLRTQLEINDAERAIIDYDTLSNTLNQIKECAASIGGISALGNPGAAAATCINAVAQIAIGLQKNALQKQISEGQDNIARLSFVERMSQNVTALEHASLSLLESREQVNGALSRIDGIKKKAKLAISRALYFASYQSETQKQYDNSVGLLEALAKKRFDQALKNAKLMSFLAKRAIEQRLGVHLSELREGYPLVDAPSTWESETCSYGGFQELEDPEAPKLADGTLQPQDWVAKYGEGFIGDYVTKLENFVESYRLTHNFHEGKDTAVISLRDDVANVRAPCAQLSRNLFRNAANMRAEAWQPLSCNAVTNGSTPIVGINCISAVPRAAVPDLAVKGLAGHQDPAPGFKLQFGDGGTCAVATGGGCGWKAGSALGQVVTLKPGRYRLSWYTRDTDLGTTVNGRHTDIVILRGTGSLPAPIPVNSHGKTSPFVFGVEGSGTDWKRATKEFTIAVDGDYEVGFGVPTTATPLPAQEVTIGAPMLESIGSGRAYLLANFQDTDADGLATLATCEDTDGAIFRVKKWSRSCVRQCAQGFSASCQKGVEHCYRELNFGISQSAIQNGKLLNYSGFAKGNFNYRIDSLGVNFVGSNIRNCENVDLPSTCYNAGFVPYSLLHNGPFFIRNRAGEDYQTLLFDGKIEHARGLALERYFTSPLASTDRDLMTDYMRSEFTGRPLDGTFVLRVWEDQGLDFSQIQDVQLLLNYRYWTAFE